MGSIKWPICWWLLESCRERDLIFGYWSLGSSWQTWGWKEHWLILELQIEVISRLFKQKNQDLLVHERISAIKGSQFLWDSCTDHSVDKSEIMLILGILLELNWNKATSLRHFYMLMTQRVRRSLWMCWWVLRRKIKCLTEEDTLWTLAESLCILSVFDRENEWVLFLTNSAWSLSFCQKESVLHLLCS